MIARTNVLFLLAAERLGFEPRQNAIYELSIPQVNARADIGALVKIGTLYLQAIDGLFNGLPDQADEFLSGLVAGRSAREHHGPRVARAAGARWSRTSARSRTCPTCSKRSTRRSSATAACRGCRPRAASARGSTIRRPSSASSSRCRTRPSRAARSPPTRPTRCSSPAARRPSGGWRTRAQRRASRRRSVTFLVGAGRAGFRGGFDPAHDGVIAQFARADGVTLQGIRADAPADAARLAAALREAIDAERRTAPAVNAADRESLARLLEAGVKAHTSTLLTDRAAHRALRRPRAADARPHPRHRLGELRALDPGVSRGMGRRRTNSPTTAICATPGPKASRCRAPSSSTSDAPRSACRPW